MRVNFPTQKRNTLQCERLIRGIERCIKPSGARLANYLTAAT